MWSYGDLVYLVQTASQTRDQRRPRAKESILNIRYTYVPTESVTPSYRSWNRSYVVVAARRSMCRREAHSGGIRDNSTLERDTRGQSFPQVPTPSRSLRSRRKPACGLRTPRLPTTSCMALVIYTGNHPLPTKSLWRL